MTRILLIHPGHGFSTHDVYTGVLAGLQAHGVDVVEYRLDHALRMYGALLDAADEVGIVEDADKPETAGLMPRPDLHQMAASNIGMLALAQRFDAMIAITGNNLHFTVPLALRQTGVPTALICTESPYQTTIREQHDAAAYDYVFTNERRAVSLFTRNAPERVHYLPHAYNPAVHQRGTHDPAQVCDVYFVGTAFEERKRLFGAINWTGIDFRCTGALWHGTATTEEKLRGVTPNSIVAAGYRSAKININHHRTTQDYRDGSQIEAHMAESLGPRAYEIAACGGFQLMDDSRPEAREVFGESLVTYKSGDSADLERQIRFFLSRPDVRHRLAAAQYEAVQPHSWHQRARRILDIILNEGEATHGDKTRR
jgi:spore maturation protein CgeB